MLVIVFTFAVLVLLLVRDMSRKRSKKWKNLCEFPGDQPLPLVGNALTLGFDSDGATKRLMDMWERHGKTSFRVSVGSEDWVLLSDPDHVGTLYNDPSILSKSPERNAAVIPFFGKSVSTSEGERWRWARKLILSSFHVKSIGQRLDVVNAYSEKLIKMLNECERKEAVSLYEYLRPFMLDVLFRATKRLMDMWERHGKTSFRVSVGSEDWVLLSDPDHVGTLYNDPSILSKSPERNAAVIPFFGKSVSTSEGERWRWARKLILSSFHVKSIGQRLDVVNAYSEKLIKMLNECERKEAVSLYEYLRPFMLDVLFKTLMGVDSNFLDDLNHPYLTESGKVINIITENYFSYWRNIRPIFVLTPTYKEMMTAINSIRKTARDVIEKRKAKIQLIRNEIKINNETDTIDTEVIVRNKVSEFNTLLDAFLLKNLRNGDPVPEEVIDEEISFIYFTGHFTTAVTISHTLYCLAKNPEIQKRVLDEQQSVFYDDYLKKPTMRDLNEMIYLEAAIKETLRTIPTVPKIGRKLKNDLVFKDGRVIPAGTTAIVYYEAMFMNEKVFPKPHQFNPDRFLHNNIHPYAFSPFGGGPRSCIGSRFAWMAMKATLSNILRQFEVAPGTEPQFSYRMVTESKNGVSLCFKNRTVESQLFQIIN